MIINSILSLAFLWSWKKCHLHFRQLQMLRQKISSAAIESVGEAIKKMDAAGEGKKVFLIIKGLLKLKLKLRGEKSIYSLIDLSEIKQGRLGQHLLKKSWEDLADKAYWKQPHNAANLEFQIQDMLNPIKKIVIKGSKEANLSGALNELYKDHNITSRPSNLLIRFAVKVYNFFVSRAPLCYLLGTTKIGEELTLYGIQDGQYSLIIGEFEKDAATHELVCKFPNYVTKQRSYVISKILKQEKRLMLITFLLASLLIITGIKFIRRLYDYFKKYRMRQMVVDEKEERSEDEGDNCNCIVCYENVRNIIFKPCLHYAVCKSCFKLLPRSTCPYCKESIDDTIEVVKKK